MAYIRVDDGQGSVIAGYRVTYTRDGRRMTRLFPREKRAARFIGQLPFGSKPIVVPVLKK